MRMIYATYNAQYNCIDVNFYEGYILRIDCNKAEEGLDEAPNSQCALNALATHEPLEYARLVLNNEMADWGWAQDNLFMLPYA